MSVSDNSALQHGIKDYEPAGGAEKEYLSDIIRWPGYWEAGEGCLDGKPVGFCTNGHVQIGSADPCGTRTCPEHWYQWRRRQAANSVARLAAVRFVAGGPRSRERRAVHLMTAPEQDQRWTTRRRWKERSASYEQAAEAGAAGGVTIPHAYRFNEMADELYAEAVETGEVEPEYGKARYCREQADDWGDLLELVEVAPHHHHLARGADIDGEAVDELNEATGEVVVNIRSLAPFYVDEREAYATLGAAERKAVRVEARREGRKPFENLEAALDGKLAEMVREGYEDMGRLMLYTMSHADVQPRTGDLGMRQTVTNWGEVSTLDPEEDLRGGVWATIQRRAAEAVGGEVPDEEEGDELGRECAREGCEAPVEPVGRLTDYLSNVGEFEGWFEGLDFEQQCEIWGLKTYCGDRPPPGTGPPGDDSTTLPPGGFQRNPSAGSSGVDRTKPEEIVEWLRRLGRSRLHRATVLAPDLHERGAVETGD